MTISTQDAFADRAKAHLRNWGADTRHGHVEMLTAFAEAEALRAPRQPLEADLAATLDRIVTEYPVNHGSTFCKNLAEAALRWYRMRPASPPSPQETRRALERAQKIIERDFPNGQLAIDIRAALSTSPAPAEDESCQN